jgi:Domain of unknown function (DUF397)
MTGDLSCIHWRKSSRSASGSQCVEIGYTRRFIFARDSKNPTGLTLAFSQAEWTEFLNAVKNNDLNLE